MREPHDARLIHAILRTVKKFLLILLLMILPLQYSWSAAAVYCQHEQGSSMHFGHHSHQHKAQVDEPDGQAKSKNVHGDCEYCHLFSHATLLPAVASLAIPAGQEHVEVRRLNFSSHIPDSPNPPDWRLVA